MKEYKIPVVWQMYGYEYVRANSLEDAIEACYEGYGLPEGECIDGSYEVDMGYVKEMYGDEK